MHKPETQSAYVRVAKHARANGCNFARYEAEKAAWSSQNPDATELEYQLAIARIARACGV